MRFFFGKINHFFLNKRKRKEEKRRMLSALPNRLWTAFKVLLEIFELRPW